MSKREQYEKEKGLDVYASMENYGSFKDEYVKWLELELENQAKNNEVLGDVGHCPLCNSDNIHQYKLHHVHCKDCKEDFNKSCG